MMLESTPSAENAATHPADQLIACARVGFCIDVGQYSRSSISFFQLADFIDTLVIIFCMRNEPDGLTFFLQCLIAAIWAWMIIESRALRNLYVPGKVTICAIHLQSVIRHKMSLI